MKTIEYKGYVAKIEFDDEDQIFVGEVIGIDQELIKQTTGLSETELQKVIFNQHPE